MVKKVVFFCWMFISFFFVNGYTVDLQTLNENVKFSINGDGWFYFGQVARGTGIEGEGTVRKIWTESALGCLSLKTNIDDKLKLVLSVEATMKFSWKLHPKKSQTKIAQPLVWLGETYGVYTLGNENIGFEACAGYFAYKYNPDVRNLGEYLFRSATFPAYIITDFDYPKAKLLGLRLGLKLPIVGLSYDAMLTTETVFYPAMDWSISNVVNYNVANLDFVSIGAGVSFAHLFSVYPDDETSVGSFTRPNYEKSQYIDKNGDTCNYTFEGTKLMARLSIDPLAFVKKNSTVFGKSDLKIYGELLIIGLESYPDSTLLKVYNPSYSDWKEKAPVTFGINFPTFNLLDVFNLELEYFGSKYYNDYRQIYAIDGLPVSPAFNEGIKESKWKWSVYLKKSFFKERCAITTQFARDHMRLFSIIYDDANHREMLVQAGDWWWATKLSFSF